MTNERGNILIMVLFVMLSMSILVMGLSYQARSDLERTRLYRDRAKAYWLARAAVERVKFDYASAMLGGAFAEVDGQDARQRNRYNYRFAEGTAECLIFTEASKMSVNSQNREQWMQLLSMYVEDEQARQEIVDAIWDWRDGDDMPQLNGAEIDYYQALTPPYTPRNGPFFSVEELMLVRGITEAMFYGGAFNGEIKPGLKDLLSEGSRNTGRFDINSCPKGILMAFLEISSQDADAIIRAREEQSFETLDEAFELIPVGGTELLNQFFQPRSNMRQSFTIRATAYINGSPARYTVEDEVRYVAGARLFTNLSHKDFSLDHVDETLQTEEDL